MQCSAVCTCDGCTEGHVSKLQLLAVCCFLVIPHHVVVHFAGIRDRLPVGQHSHRVCAVYLVGTDVMLFAGCHAEQVASHLCVSQMLADAMEMGAIR